MPVSQRIPGIWLDIATKLPGRTRRGIQDNQRELYMRGIGRKTGDRDGQLSQAASPIGRVTAELVQNSKCCCMSSIFIHCFTVRLRWILCAMGRNDISVIQERFKTKIHIDGTSVFIKRYRLCISILKERVPMMCILESPRWFSQQYTDSDTHVFLLRGIDYVFQS